MNPLPKGPTRAPSVGAHPKPNNLYPLVWAPSAPILRPIGAPKDTFGRLRRLRPSAEGALWSVNWSLVGGSAPIPITDVFFPGTSRDPLGILRIGALGILTIPKAPTAPKGAEGAEFLIFLHPVGRKRPWGRGPKGPVPSSFLGPEANRRRGHQPAQQRWD